MLKGDDKTSKITLMLPINFREPLDNKSDKTLGNQATSYPFELPLIADFKTALSQVSSDLLKLRRSYVTIGMYYLAEIALALPYPLDLILANFASKKISLIFTNVFGPTQSVKIAGAKSLKVKTMLPGLKGIAGGFAIISHRDNVSVSFTSDKARCSDGSLVISLFEQIIESII